MIDIIQTILPHHLWKGRSEHHPLRFPFTYVLWRVCIAFTHDHAQTRNTPTDIRQVVDGIHQALLLFLYLVVSVAEYFHTSSLKMMATQQRYRGRQKNTVMVLEAKHLLLHFDFLLCSNCKTMGRFQEFIEFIFYVEMKIIFRSKGLYKYPKRKYMCGFRQTHLHTSTCTHSL